MEALGAATLLAEGDLLQPTTQVERHQLQSSLEGHPALLHAAQRLDPVPCPNRNQLPPQRRINICSAPLRKLPSIRREAQQLRNVTSPSFALQQTSLATNIEPSNAPNPQTVCISGIDVPPAQVIRSERTCQDLNRQVDVEAPLQSNLQSNQMQTTDHLNIDIRPDEQVMSKPAQRRTDLKKTDLTDRKCRFCKKVYATNSNRIKHERVVHKFSNRSKPIVKPIFNGVQCKSCTTCRKHKRTRPIQPAANQFECRFCENIYSTISNRIKHERVVHRYSNIASPNKKKPTADVLKRRKRLVVTRLSSRRI